jgi:DNA-directed RNA polymerase subunit H (RpoH/RPB5)
LERFFMKKPLVIFGLGVLLLMALNAAEGAERMIATEYKPNAKVKGSPAFITPLKIFIEEFKDERPNPQQVGENLENKGKRVLIVTKDPRAAGQLVRSALQTEFRKKGFQEVDQPDRADKILTGALLKFWTVETTRYNTQTEVRVEVKDARGKVYFGRVYSGVGKNFGRSLSEVNYNESFSDSLVMIVEALLGDPEFINGLAEKPLLPPPPPAEKQVAKPAPGLRPPETAPRRETPPPSKTVEPEAPVEQPRAPVKTLSPAPPVKQPEAVAPQPLPKSPPAGGSKETQPTRAALPAATVPEPVPTSPPAPPLLRPEKEKSAAVPFIEHLVVPGETLATIAKWYAGESTAWPEIAKHNPGMHPFRLKGGDLVKVPRSLATVHTEQPDHSTAPETNPKPAKKTPKAQPAPHHPPAAAPEPAHPAFGPK